MDNHKKLSEALLQADGIDPVGATEPERAAFASMLDRQLKPKHAKPVIRPDIWRLIMKSKMTKYAAVAVIIVGLCVGMNILNGTPAYAIEQTIEALRGIQGIYVAGTVYYPDHPDVDDFEIWGKPHRQDASVSGDFRLHEGDTHIALASAEQNLTFVYTKLPEQNVVYITEGLNRNFVLFPTSNLLEQLSEIAVNWQEEYGKDPATGRDSVFVTFEGPGVNTARYWSFQFDLQTKFPVRASMWWNKERSGRPHYDFTTITYNPEMPDDLFTFEMPQATQVIDCRLLRQTLDENPDYGITVDNLSVDEACKKVAQRYWQSVIDQDVSGIQNIRPLATGSEWERLSALYDRDRPVMLMHISNLNHLNDPGTFAEVTCILTTRNGKTAKSILNIDLRQTSRGTIGVVAGTVGPELSIVN